MKNITKKNIDQYLQGILWIVDYYMNLDDSKEFVYSPNRSPLLHELIEYHSKNKITLKKAKSISILEHKKLISPNIELLKKYLPNNFKGKLDCTSSIFTNKCHVIL